MIPVFGLNLERQNVAVLRTAERLVDKPAALGNVWIMLKRARP